MQRSPCEGLKDGDYDNINDESDEEIDGELLELGDVYSSNSHHQPGDSVTGNLQCEERVKTARVGRVGRVGRRARRDRPFLSSGFHLARIKPYLSTTQRGST